MDYRQKLKEYRQSKNKTQKEIAEILKISQQQYSLYENSTREMPIGKYALLAKFFNVRIDDLIEIIEEPNENRPKDT